MSDEQSRVVVEYVTRYIVMTRCPSDPDFNNHEIVGVFATEQAAEIFRHCYADERRRIHNEKRREAFESGGACDPAADENWLPPDQHAWIVTKELAVGVSTR